MSNPLRKAHSDAPPASRPPAARRASGEYRPAIDAHAARLIARIQRNHQDVDAVVALQAHYEAHCDFPSLANLLEGWAQTLRDDRKAADAYAKAADAVAAGGLDAARAQALYLQALQRYPEHAPALDRLEAMLAAQRDDKTIEQVLSYLASELSRRNAEPERRAALHHRLGRHYEQRMLQPGRAIAQYRTALEIDPAYRPAIEAALEIYMASGNTAAVADMYELKIAASADMAERHTLLMELAKFRRERLGDLDGSVLAVRRALKALPNETSTLELLANLLRERSQALEGQAAEADRFRAAELFFQVARLVRRSHARPRLHACLQLAPDHARARRMLAELDGYGAQPDAEPDLGEVSQAELEAMPTGRYAPAQDPGSAAYTRRTLEIEVTATDAEPLDVTDEELAAWLDEDEVTLIGSKVDAGRARKAAGAAALDTLDTTPRYDARRLPSV